MRDAGDMDSGADAGGYDSGVTPMDLTVRIVDRDDTAVDRAVFLFDAPDGTRMEGASGTDGRYTFEGIEWTGSGVEMIPASDLRHYVIAHPNGDSGYIQQPAIILVND